MLRSGFLMEYFWTYSHFFSAIIFATLSFIIIAKDPRSLLNLTCASVLICLFIWSAGETVIHHPTVPLEIAEIFERFCSVGWIFFSFFFLWFIWLFTKKPAIPFFKFLVFLNLLIPAALVFQQVVNSRLINEHTQQSWGWLLFWSSSIWTYLFFVYNSSSVLIGIILIYTALKKSNNPLFKRQSTLILITGSISMITGLVVNIIMPIYFRKYVVPVADITALIWAIGLSYAVFKYRILDITPFIAAGRIIDVMNDLLFLLDLNGHIISVNRSSIKSLDCHEKQLIGIDFRCLINEKDPKKSSILNVIRTSSSASIETTLSVTPGPSIPVTLSTSLIPGSGIVCVAHDISLQKMRTESLNDAKKMLETEVSRATTELQKTNQLLVQEISDHKQAAVELMETEERFRVVFENAPDGMYLEEKNGNILDVNHEALRIAGFNKAKVIGVSIDEIGLHLEPTPNLTVGTPYESTILRADGTSVPIEFSNHIVKVQGRELILGVVRDISLRKKSESEAEHLKAQLLQAQKMEAIGRLAGGIAHDFNNLLGGIIGYTGVLQKLLKTQPKESEIVNKIHNVARQATDRVAQLLAFARKGKYQVGPVDIHEVVDEITGLLEHTIDKKITLMRAFKAAHAVVSGDHSQLHSAILNLAVNARDALPDGGMITFITEQVCVTDNTTVSDVPDQFIKIKVQDNGIGMDEETRSRIFEPFFSTKEQGKGTGLGLASVYGTVKNHNGLIELESAPGTGTTFTITLPLINAQPPVISTEAAPEISMDQTGTILIVDDIDILREMMAESLKEMGFTTHGCNDGAEALEWFGSHHNECDLIILDLTMPVMGGRECFNALKKIDPALKVIVTSGHAMDTEIGDILKEGARAFLQKPFEIDEMILTVKKALE
ncbi:MAG TPA: PAS domain S-box protein [Chitinispirillaceae bacterium]|nr:PAS domain S-box protein [Chitinispirillaceae bacterium]